MVIATALLVLKTLKSKTFAIASPSYTGCFINTGKLIRATNDLLPYMGEFLRGLILQIRISERLFGVSFRDLTFSFIQCK